MDESRATDGATDLEAQKMFIKPNAELERMEVWALSDLIVAVYEAEAAAE